MNKIEMGKQYRTRSGLDVSLQYIEEGGLFSVYGDYLSKKGQCKKACWTATGSWTGNATADHLDLIEVEEPK